MGYTGEKKRRYNRDWIAGRRQRAIALLGGRCAWCGSMQELEVDHVEPARWCGYRSPGGAMWSWSWSRILTELAKCWLLCKDCHRVKTRDDRPEVLHGSASMWHAHKCRCPECRAWMAAAQRDYRARRAAGQRVVAQ